MLFKPEEFSLMDGGIRRPFDAIEPFEWLAMTIFGEARGEIQIIQNYVGLTVLARVRKGKWFGSSIREVVIKDYQFSCFNPNDPNFQKIQIPNKYEDSVVFNKCADIAYRLVDEFGKDGDCVSLDFCPLFYHTIKDKEKYPDWTKDLTLIKTFRSFKFYR